MASQNNHILKQKKNFSSQNKNKNKNRNKRSKQNKSPIQEYPSNNEIRTDHEDNSLFKDGKENEEIQGEIISSTNPISTVKSGYNRKNYSLFTSKYNYNSSFSKLPVSVFKHKRQQPLYNNNNNFILIQIDNLPPNKSWKQIKYLIGGIIHHSNVLQVKLLPPMSSLVPPFIVQQSCLVTLTNTLNEELVNDLISTLNSYTWDNYDLYSYIIPSSSSLAPVPFPPIPFNPSSYSVAMSPSSSFSSSSSSPSSSSLPFTTHDPYSTSNIPFDFISYQNFLQQQQQHNNNNTSNINIQPEMKQKKEQVNYVKNSSSSRSSSSLPFRGLPFIYPMFPPTTYFPQKQYREPQQQELLKHSATSLSKKNTVDTSFSPAFLPGSPKNNNNNKISMPSKPKKKNHGFVFENKEKQEAKPFPSFVPTVATSPLPSELSLNQQPGMMLLPQPTSMPPIFPTSNLLPPFSFPLPPLPSQSTSKSFSIRQTPHGKKSRSNYNTNTSPPPQQPVFTTQVYNKNLPSNPNTTIITATSSSSTNGSPKGLVPKFKKQYSYFSPPPPQYINPYDTNNDAISKNGFGEMAPFYFPEQFKDMMGLTTNMRFIYPPLSSHKRNANPFKQPKKLKSIFNERNFRKQMTERSMWQLKLENFPPYLLPETETPIKNGTLNQEENIKVDIVTTTIERYGKLRWTVLKDFIKLACPTLLDLRGQYNESIGDTTREFYVGVYEAEEINLIVEIKPEDNMGQSDIGESKKLVQMEAILYNAIIGFHNKEYFDICLKNLQNKEYSLGYKLHVTELPPYNEKDEKEKRVDEGEDEDKVDEDVTNNNTNEDIEGENIIRGINDLNIN